MLQLALDFATLPPAIVMAAKASEHVDILEIGTPLCKSAGLEAIRSIREVCPDKLILADFKTPDVGGLEAQMAFDSGADMMTVIGGAPMATVQSALETANKYGKEMLMELTGVRDIIARATEWRQVGVERMVYHRGWDEEAYNRQWGQDDLDTIQRLIDMGFKVTVTGGLKAETLPFFKDLGVSVVITGRAIHAAPDPNASALNIRSTIHQLWGGGHAGYQPNRGGHGAAMDNAAKAVRWAVSEMGLKLTMDGSNCPGCDAPGHLCQGTYTTIFAPSGVNVDELVSGMQAIMGPSRAYGRVASNSFYLDPAMLDNPGAQGVVQLLSALGNTLIQRGFRCDLNQSLSVANQILNI
jgi:3-dehydro-L-gulonate-6-phosphate decarboxylase